jgi:hypothetical protein
MERHECSVIRIQRQHFFRFPDHGLQVAVLLTVVQGDASLLAVEQQLHPAQTPLHLSDARDGPYGIKALRGDRLHVLALRDCKDQPLRGGQRRLDGAKRGRSAGPDRSRYAGEQHNLPQREDRQCQPFSHFVSYLLNAPRGAVVAPSASRSCSSIRRAMRLSSGSL